MAQGWASKMGAPYEHSVSRLLTVGSLVLFGVGHPALAQAELPLRTPESTGKSGQAPDWSKDELKDLFARVQNAARAPTVVAQDEAIAEVAGLAYRVKRGAGESVEGYARRTLRTREPEHPAVKEGQWLLALTRMFYADASARFGHLARFELSHADRQYLQHMSQQTAQYAAVIGQQLQMIIEGLDGTVELLPPVGGEPPTRLGAMVRIHSGGTITIEGLDRVMFKDHRAPEDRARTGSGALREVYSAQRQYNVSAEMLGPYERKWRKNHGHVQVILPSVYPARYLNEVVRGAKEAGMHTLHLLTMTPRGELRELRASLEKASDKAKKKAKDQIEVRCDDDDSAERCARRIRYAATQGTPYFAVD